MKTNYLSLFIFFITGCISSNPNLASSSTLTAPLKSFCNSGRPVGGTLNEDWELLKAIKSKLWEIEPCPGFVHDAFEYTDRFNIVARLNHPNSAIQELEVSEIKHIKGGSRLGKRNIQMLPSPFNRARVVQGHANIMGYFFVPGESHIHFVTFNFEKKEDGTGFGFTYRVSPVGEEPELFDDWTHNDYGGGTERN